MIWFWIIASILTLGMSLIFHKNCKEAIISTVIILLAVFAFSAIEDEFSTEEKQPNTYLSGQVEKIGD